MAPCRPLWRSSASTPGSRCPAALTTATPALISTAPKTSSWHLGAAPWVRTGVAVAVPFGMVGLVHPRSGLATRVGLSIVNSPGTIDAGYRGEIKVALINLDPAAPIVVHRGDRIAQLLVQRVELVELVEVSSFDEAGLASTSRGDGGHGSSGGHASL